jgi:hypothetical protein
MSPFMSANKIKKPILLIHGEEDNNSGTLTMQVNGNLTFSKSAFTELDILMGCISIFFVMPQTEFQARMGLTHRAYITQQNIHTTHYKQHP